jgi:hypothetical protein
VKVNVPSEAGLPVIRPDGLRLNPDGRVPERRLKDTGGSPPEVCICLL